MRIVEKGSSLLIIDIITREREPFYSEEIKKVSNTNG